MKRLKNKAEKGARPRGPILDDATFQSLRHRITESSGIYVVGDENSRFILERRLAPRLRVLGLTSFLDYDSALDEDELETMLDTIAIHETYFFREKRQLDVFAEQILPELSRSEKPLKIWSAGCSTGEEAYTIAMLLAERGMLKDDRAQVIGSDLSRRVILSAMRGEYGPSSFRSTDPYFLEKYFYEVSNDILRASDSVRAAVGFEQFNLIDLNSGEKNIAPAGAGGFDVIFCRNVLMYFDEAAVKNTLKSLHSLLKGGGYLLLGHAESLMPLGTGFEPVQFDRELVHRKKVDCQGA